MVIFTEYPLNSITNKEERIQAVFKTFGGSSVHIATEALLSLDIFIYTTVSMDSGNSDTYSAQCEGNACHMHPRSGLGQLWLDGLPWAEGGENTS